MISREQILKVTCPRCGCAVGTRCLSGGRGKLRAAQHPERVRRAIQERDFWAWVDERLAEPPCSFTEQELLDSITRLGWTGRKARSARLQVVQMPMRDFKMAAAGDDFDDAA